MIVDTLKCCEAHTKTEQPPRFLKLPDGHNFCGTIDRFKKVVWHGVGEFPTIENKSQEEIKAILAEDLLIEDI